MPVYTFEEPESGKIISVLVTLDRPDKERHEQIGDDGKVYKRVYAAPMAATNTSIGEASKEDFRRMTTDKKGMKVGDLWTISAEMAAHRKDKEGVDRVQEGYYRKFERENGVKCEAEIKEIKRRQAKERAAKFGIKVE